jgi:hypothetical protein
MVKTLQHANVLDDESAWVGGNTHLVIVGDILDRGPDSRKTMNLLMRLEVDAEAAGGKVHVLIGNHEAMNLTGDLRYVSREEYAAFADEERAEDRELWFTRFSEKRAKDAGSYDEQRQAFDQRFPPGFFAHRQAFSSTGMYGRWLLSKPIMVVINGTAFVHGGLSPMVADVGLDGANQRITEQLQSYVRDVETLTAAGMLLPTDGYYEHARLAGGVVAALMADQDVAAAIKTVTEFDESEAQALDGPLWYRGNVACNAIIEVERVSAALDAIGAKRVVIGHTPTFGRQVLERFDGRVIEVDTGMLRSYYEGRGQALVIEADKLGVVDEADTTVSAPRPHPRRVGLRADGLDASDIEKLLAAGNIVSDREDSLGRRIVTVSDGMNQIDAEFVRRAGRDFYPEVAAYRVDTLLQLDMVPVAVVRAIDGKEGSLQFLPGGTTDETKRRETGRGGAAMCPLPLQWSVMTIFDALIHNDGRVGTSIRYTESTYQLILAAHSKAFGTKRDRPKHLDGAVLTITTGWQQALNALGDESLSAHLGDVLDNKRLGALGARRDMLLEQAASGR